MEHVRSHFPINSGVSRIKLTFSWYDAFTRRKFSQGNIFYEQANLLFNAAVILSQIGANETRSNENSVKSAAKYFQQAAGILDFIKDSISPNIVERIPKDISSECLECLSLLMLAYAQQCIYEKAIMSKMKNSTLSLLSYETSVMYGLVGDMMSTSNLNELFGKV